jgi:hypothetical protein
MSPAIALAAGPEMYGRASLSKSPPTPDDWHPERRRTRVQAEAKLRRRRGRRMRITALLV